MKKISISLKKPLKYEAPKTLKSKNFQQCFSFRNPLQSDSTRCESLRKTDFSDLLNSKNSFRYRESFPYQLETESTKGNEDDKPTNRISKNKSVSLIKTDRSIKTDRLINTLKDQYIKNIVTNFNEAKKKYKTLKYMTQNIETDLSRDSASLSNCKTREYFMNTSIKKHKFNQYINSTINNTIKKEIYTIEDENIQTKDKINKLKEETEFIQKVISNNQKLLTNDKINQVKLSNTINKLIEENKELTTSIVLIEKKKKELKEKLDKHLKKQIMVNSYLRKTIKNVS